MPLAMRDGKLTRTPSKVLSPIWRVPLWQWSGEPCVILGGGPSLPKKLVPKLKGRVRVIAINDAGLVLAPWADILYFSDAQWFEWNVGEIHKFKGQHIISRSEVGDARVKRIGRSLRMPLSSQPDILAGVCGGANAINIAHLYAASPIVLLGFDMRPGNWHTRHQKPPRPNCHAADFIPSLNRMAPLLAEAGRQVINATPGSALACFPIMEPEEALRGII